MATAKRVVRPPRIERPTGLPMWFKIALGLLATLVAAHFYLMYQINKAADGLVQTVNMFAAGSHRGGYYTWDGNLGIRRLRIESGTENPTSLAIAEFELDTPGWWWVLQLLNPAQTPNMSRAMAAFGNSQTSLLPAADQLHVHLRGVELDVSGVLPPGLPDVGFSSGALFETEGCSNVRYFVPLNLQRDLGLAYKQTDLSFGYRATGPDQVLVDMSYEAPGVTRSRVEMDFSTAAPRRFLENPGNSTKLQAIRWIVTDMGFVEARNRWCAEQAKVDADEFQRRHITTVRRVLEVFGIRLTPETEAVYSSFASAGGTLTIAAKVPSSASAPSFAAYSAEEQWNTLNPQIGHNNDARIPLALEFVPARPLPRAYSGSVWDLIAKRADSGAAVADPLAAFGAQMRGMATQAQADQSVEAAPAEPPKPAPSHPSAPVPTTIGMDTASLTAVIGQRVSIQSSDGRARVGILTAVEPLVLTIEVAAGNGKAKLDFTRERIRAVVINPRERR